MNPIEDDAGRIRRELLARERQTQRELVRVYGEAIRRTRRQLNDLTIAIREAKAHPDDRGRLLARERRLEQLLDGLRFELSRYVRTATPAITQLQRDNAGRAVGDAHDLTLTALGPGPQAGFEFRPPPALVTARLIGNAADGTPLGELLHEIAGAQIKQARDTLLVGIALGHGPRQIARDFKNVTGITLTRSILIARTEGLRAHRQATLETFRSNAHVVKGWRWQATLDKRTCPMCWAMSGTRHSLDELLASHPACRCAMVPVTASWADLGFPDIPDMRPPVLEGPAVFADLPAAMQRQILGPGKHDAYVRGELTLPDLVRRTRSERWGPGRRTASLREALSTTAA